MGPSLRGGLSTARRLAAAVARHLPRRRRFHAYGVGVSRSGTTSLAQVFLPRYRSEHEPEWRSVVRIVMDVADGRRSDDEVRRWVVERDARLRLEMDSSHLNSWLIAHLVAAFPEARFVLLLRDPYRWLASIVSRQTLRRMAKDPLRVEFFRVRFPPIPADPERERAFAGLGLPSLASYLCYWGEHNRRILAAVPAERLLVVRTHELGDSLGRIADFVGVPVGTLSAARAHSNRRRGHAQPLDTVDRPYLDGLVERYGGDLVRRFFPELRAGAAR
jgi:hypothetical protein